MFPCRFTLTPPAWSRCYGTRHTGSPGTAGQSMLLRAASHAWANGGLASRAPLAQHGGSAHTGVRRIGDACWLVAIFGCGKTDASVSARGQCERERTRWREREGRDSGQQAYEACQTQRLECADGRILSDWHAICQRKGPGQRFCASLCRGLVPLRAWETAWQRIPRLHSTPRQAVFKVATPRGSASNLCSSPRYQVLGTEVIGYNIPFAKYVSKGSGT